MRKITSFFVLITFIASCVMPPHGFAQAMTAVGLMSAPGAQVALTASFTPTYLKGLKIDPKNPLKFDFLIYRGDDNLTVDQKQDEYPKLIKYFLAALAVPDKEQWVNLSPYEQDRIIPDNFGLTEMGRDLLAQDYLLKQISASLTSPDSDLGKKFWEEVYSNAQAKFGTTNIPTDTFNKVWITPDKAVVYEKGDTVYVLENHLKVQMEKDYVAASHQREAAESRAPARDLASDTDTALLSQQVMREVIIPALEKEVNEGKNFAPLRQVYSGMLLATWYKRTLKETILGKLYADQNKVKGVDQDPKNNQQIYEQYVQAFQKGVVNMIKEDVDKFSNEVIPRKYFSGGMGSYDKAEIVKADAVQGQADFAAKSGNVDSAAVQFENVMPASDAVEQQVLAETFRNLGQQVADYVNKPGAGTTDHAMLLKVKDTLLRIKSISEQELNELPAGAATAVRYIKGLKGDKFKQALREIKDQGYTLSDFQKLTAGLDGLIKTKALSLQRLTSLIVAGGTATLSGLLANEALYHMPKQDDMTALVLCFALLFSFGAATFGWDAIFPGKVYSLPDQADIARNIGGADIFSDGPYTYDTQQQFESFVVERLKARLESLKDKRLLRGKKVGGVILQQKLAQSMVGAGIFRVVCVNPDRPVSERAQWKVEFDAAQKPRDGNALFEEVRVGNRGPYAVTFQGVTQVFTKITIYNGTILLGEKPDGIWMPFHPTEVKKFDDAVAPVVWQEFYKSLQGLSLSKETRQLLDQISFRVIFSGERRYEAIREIVRILEDSGSAQDKARIEDLWQRFSSSIAEIESYLSPDVRESVKGIRRGGASLASVKAIVNVLDAAQKEAIVESWPGQSADQWMESVFDALRELGPGGAVTAVWDKGEIRIKMKHEDIKDEEQGKSLFMGAFYFFANQGPVAKELEGLSSEEQAKVVAAFYMAMFDEKNRQAYGLTSVPVEALTVQGEEVLQKMQARDLGEMHSGGVAVVLQYLYHTFLNPERASDAAQGAILTENMDIDTALKAFVTALSPKLADEGRQIRLFRDLRRYIAKKPQTQELNDFVRNVLGELLRAYAESQGNEKFFAGFVMELNRKVIAIDALKVAILYGNDQEQELVSWASLADEVVKDTIAMIKADPGAALGVDSAQGVGIASLEMINAKTGKVVDFKGNVTILELGADGSWKKTNESIQSGVVSMKMLGPKKSEVVDLNGVTTTWEQDAEGNWNKTKEADKNGRVIILKQGADAVWGQDDAQSVDQAEFNKGGIDFNSAALDMQIKRDGNGIVLPVSQQDLDNIRINGLVPVILDIRPATNVPLFSELPQAGPSAA